MPSTDMPTGPLRGHVVSFPKAIPSRTWMAQRILWADQIGAVWPDGDPTARNAEDTLALEDANKYREAELFTPCTLPAKTGPSVMSQLEATLKVTVAEARKWQTESGIEGSGREPEDDLQFVYLGKYPPQVQDALLRSGVAKTEGDYGLVIASRERALTLMAVLAENAEPQRELKLERILDTDNAFALAMVAATPQGGRSRPAAMLDLSMPSGGAGNISADKLLAFRSDDRNRDARSAYLESVDEYLQDVLRVHPSVDSGKEAAAKLRRDLDLARRSWVKRAQSAGLTEVALSTVSLVAPLPAAASLGEWVGLGAGMASAGILATTLVRKSHVKGYLNSARRARVLA